MATAQEIIIAARRRLGIHAEEEPLEAVDAASGLSILQSMLKAWTLDSSIKTYSAPNLATAVTVTIHDDTVLTDIDFGVAANLAARIASSINAQIPADVVMDADLGKGSIVRKHVLAQLEPSKYDPSISYMPSQRYIELVDTSE